MVRLVSWQSWSLVQKQYIRAPSPQTIAAVSFVWTKVAPSIADLGALIKKGKGSFVLVKTINSDNKFIFFFYQQR